MLPTTNGILATYIPRLNYKQAATVGGNWVFGPADLHLTLETRKTKQTQT